MLALAKTRLSLLLCVLILWQVAVLARHSGFSTSVLRSAFVPGAGARESLPAPVLEAAELLIHHKVLEFRLAPPLLADPLVHQRVVEYSYPARLDEAASHRLVPVNVAVAPGCQQIEARALIALHACDD